MYLIYGIQLSTDNYYCKFATTLLFWLSVQTMKKLLSIFCCILYLHSISNASPDSKAIPQRVSGEKVLVKALTALVNREGNKKAPAKKVSPFLLESI